MFQNTFKIGADPEFALIADGAAVNAETVVGYHATKSAGIHTDHGGDVLECTPEPAKSAFLLTKHINNILEQDKFICNLSDKFKLCGGATARTGRRMITLGGHVHFERAYVNPSTEMNKKALDNVTLTLEALDVLPKADSNKRRVNGIADGHGVKYGSLSDFRQANNGKTIEYRSMCSWMYSPITAFLCLTMCKLAVIDAKSTNELLVPKEASYGGVEKFLRVFKDQDAVRAIEKIFEKGLDLTAKPDTDIREGWKSITKLYRKRVI